MASNPKSRVISAWLSLITSRSLLRLYRKSESALSSSFDPDAVKSILVHRVDAMGDSVLTLPLLQSLRERWPQAHITFAASPIATELVSNDPRVNAFIPISTRKGSLHRLTDWRRVSSETTSTGFDLAVLPRWSQDDYGCAAQSFILGSRWTVGHRQSGRADTTTVGAHSDHLLNQAVDCNQGHEVDRSFCLLDAIGVPRSTNTPPIRVPQMVSDEIAHWLAGQGVAASDSIVALGIGAGEIKRIWPVTNFAELVGHIHRSGQKVVCVGGASDLDAAQSLTKFGCIDATRLPGIKHTIALLNRCQLFIGNDSGPMHLAAAQGLPVVEISSHPQGGDPFHAHAPERFAPWGVPSVILRPDGNQVIADISASAVLDAMNQLALNR